MELEENLKQSCSPSKTPVTACSHWSRTKTKNYAPSHKRTLTGKSLDGLPPEAVERAKVLSAVFPTFIRRFEKVVAEVKWQINPDGRYYMDEDGPHNPRRRWNSKQRRVPASGNSCL